ncbi:hypothetical protein [Rubinisphaera margarita]|uniref:hypothetical protein n=1 Tax=Rubinisphaera margarita TaxID=2909586 RepID=UPI001EE802F6|nr:hypothetical protein [Rubinisphaera margarita]MCG6157992.1 hypothetical protein [Rubinisphaera margarita]
MSESTEVNPATDLTGRERIAAGILRLIGCGGLLALPAIVLPLETLTLIHAWLGLGTIPSDPVVEYLARTTSLFYVVAGVITLAISADLDRYRPLARLWAWCAIGKGAAVLLIDLDVGLPLWWTVIEGPSSILIGFLLLALLSRKAPAKGQN